MLLDVLLLTLQQLRELFCTLKSVIVFTLNKHNRKIIYKYYTFR